MYDGEAMGCEGVLLSWSGCAGEKMSVDRTTVEHVSRFSAVWKLKCHLAHVIRDWNGKWRIRS